MVENNDIYQVDLFDEQHRLTLEDLSQLCGVQTSMILELVEEGVLEPMDLHASQWSFSGTSIRRVQIAIRLQRDLEVNIPGVALALDLMEELEELRQRLRRL